MLGTLAGCSLVEVHHPLVAVVHKVDLQSLHAHIGVMLNKVGMLLNGEPRQPQDDTYMLLGTILYQLLYIDIVAVGKGIFYAFVPTFVE